jgi:hypothetical protein
MRRIDNTTIDVTKGVHAHLRLAKRTGFANLIRGPLLPRSASLRTTCEAAALSFHKNIASALRLTEALFHPVCGGGVTEAKPAGLSLTPGKQPEDAASCDLISNDVQFAHPISHHTLRLMNFP